LTTIVKGKERKETTFCCVLGNRRAEKKGKVYSNTSHQDWREKGKKGGTSSFEMTSRLGGKRRGEEVRLMRRFFTMPARRRRGGEGRERPGLSSQIRERRKREEREDNRVYSSPLKKNEDSFSHLTGT